MRARCRQPALGVAVYVGVRVIAPVLLHAVPLDSLLVALTPTSSRPTPELTYWLDEAERWVDRSRLLPATCLYRSIARYAVLRRAGVAASLVMGVRNTGADLDGHAWIETDGSTEDVRAASFTPTFRYPFAASS